MDTIIQQRSEEWFNQRLGKATASRFHDITATTRSGSYTAGRKNYKADLVIERLTGKRAPMFTTPAMQWGIDMEPLAKLAYESETGNQVADAPFMEHPVLDAGASPDGFVEEGLLEIKCPNSATHIETLVKQQVPYQYVAQVQGQLWVTGADWCDFVSFDPRLPLNAQLIVIRVERNETLIRDLEQEVADFLEEVTQDVAFLKQYVGNNGLTNRN